MEQNLTVGSVPKTLLKFSLPILGANLLQSLYNIVDMAVVGRLVGSAGLTAVSSATQLCYIITALCTGLTMGGSVLVSQYRGAGDEGGVRRTVGTLFTLSAIVSAIITVFGLLIYHPVFVLMNVPAEAVAYAEGYMSVAVLGTFFVFGYNAACSILRGLGDSRSPLFFVVVTTVVNVVLDLLLVGPLGMGTVGAALATVIAQGISFLVALLKLRRRLNLRFTRETLRPDRRLTGLIFRIGLPSAVQMAVLNLSYLLVTGMFNVYGVVVSAAAGVGLKVNTLAAMPCWAVGSAVTGMAGQCMGAKKPERAAASCKMGMLLALGLEVVVVGLVMLFPAPIISFFDPDPAVVAEGVRYLRICCAVNFLPYAVMYVCDSFAIGVGSAWVAMLNSMFQSVIFRIPISILLSQILAMGHVGLYWAECISPVLPAVVGLVFFLSGRWKRRSLV